MSYFLKSLYKLFSNWSNLGHKSQVYFNHKQAVRAFHIDAHIYKPVGLAGGLFYRLNLFSMHFQRFAQKPPENRLSR